MSLGRFGSPPTAVAMGNVGTLVMQCVAGDTISMQGYQTSGAALATDWGAGGVGLSVTFMGV